ncbi:glycine dehydrogenase, putative [Babesia ovis]|uniref:Glycine dehydrogenase, putative n=1 Tax=Babesia ovis TaxID=5869 RepID=A0A9W5T9F6_BABOV|nr:glycine dehydrogenase, putative [Babesia ovis]
MAFNQGPVGDYLSKECLTLFHYYLGNIRASTSTCTSEKLYKRLVKYGCSFHVPDDEDVPGSKVLLGELLLAGYIERCGYGNSEKQLFSHLQEACLHPLALDIRTIQRPQQNTVEVTSPTRRSQRRRKSTKLEDVEYLYSQHDETSTAKLNNNPETPINTESIDIPDGGTSSITGVYTEGSDNDAKLNRHPPRKVRKLVHTDGAGSSSTNDVNGGKHLELDNNICSKSPEGILSAIGQAMTTVRPWDNGKNVDKLKPDGALIWNSRLATIFTVVAGIEGISDVTHCGECSSLVSELCSSFPWNLRYLLRLLKRFEDLEAVQGHLFQSLSMLYHNADALMGTFYAHMQKGLVYAHEISEQISGDSDTLTRVFLGWLSDVRIHYFIDPFIRVRMHQLLFNAIMKLVPYKEPQLLGMQYLHAFRDASISFMLGSVVHVLDEVCSAKKLSLDAYTSRGVHYAYRFNTRLQHLACMMDTYIQYVSSFAMMLDEAAALQFWTVVSPLLANDDIRRWIATIDFQKYRGEDYLMQCRMAVFILYLIVLNHQQPFLRSEDIRFMRKFHCLPWVSAIRFCCEDSVMNHMVGPLTSALVQCMGEGLLINLSTGETLATTLDHVMSDLLQPYMEPIGYRALKLQKIRELHRSTVFTPLNILCQKITTSLVGRSGRNETVSGLRYYTVANLIPLLYASSEYIEGVNVMDLAPHNKVIADSGKQTIQSQWVLSELNMLYSLESTLFDCALLDSIIYNHVLGEITMTQYNEVGLMLFNDEKELDDIQAHISSNYIALQQNPINVLLRMPSNAVMALFVLRPFCNMLIQLFYSLYKYVCYGFPTLGAQRKINLEPGHINSLQEAAALNVVLDMMADTIPRSIEMNIKSFIEILTSKSTFNDDVIAFSGLPFKDIVSSVHCGVADNKTFEKVTDRFVASVETMLKRTNENLGGIDGVRVNRDYEIPVVCLEPYSVGDVAMYHLYTVMLHVLDMPQLSKEPIDLAEDTNAQRIIRVVTTFWSCLQVASTNTVLRDFIKGSISIVLRLHYLCPWVVNISTEQLQTWIYSDHGKESELQEFVSTTIQNLRQIYRDIMEMKKQYDTK